MSHWRETTLGEACELYQPKTISATEMVDDGDYPVYGANGIVGKYDKFNHAEPQLLITCRGATCGAVNVSQPNSWINGNAMVVKPRDSSIDLNYLEHLFRGGVDLTAAITGAAQPQITRQSLAPLKIRVPPLPEQIRIAAILEQADALRLKRRDALEQLDSLAQSIFIEMFGAPATNPKGWAYKSLFELGKVVTGGTPPSAKPGMFDGPIPFVTPGDLESDEAVKRSLTTEGAKESRTVRAGATLVCCIGTIGKMDIARVRSAFNQQINAIEWSDEVDDHYGHAVLQFFRPTIKSWGASTTVPILKKSSFEKIEIPVPPQPLQRKFAERAKALEKLCGAHKTSLTELDELFASLQKRAFMGEL